MVSHNSYIAKIAKKNLGQIRKDEFSLFCLYSGNNFFSSQRRLFLVQGGDICQLGLRNPFCMELRHSVIIERELLHTEKSTFMSTSLRALKKLPLIELKRLSNAYSVLCQPPLCVCPPFPFMIGETHCTTRERVN